MNDALSTVALRIRCRPKSLTKWTSAAGPPNGRTTPMVWRRMYARAIGTGRMRTPRRAKRIRYLSVIIKITLSWAASTAATQIGLLRAIACVPVVISAPCRLTNRKANPARNRSHNGVANREPNDKTRWRCRWTTGRNSISLKPLGRETRPPSHWWSPMKGWWRSDTADGVVTISPGTRPGGI